MMDTNDIRSMFELAVQDGSLSPLNTTHLTRDEATGEYWHLPCESAWRGYAQALAVQSVVLDRLSPERVLSRSTLRDYRTRLGLLGFSDAATERLMRTAVAVMASSGGDS